MSRYPLILACVLLVTVPATAGEDCTPPSNETCEGAVIFSNADLPFQVTAPLGCVNDIIDKPYFDVFYRFSVTRTGTYLMHMCGSSGDTYIRVYSGGCGWVDGEELAVDDDSCPGSPPNADPLLLVDLEAGQHYWIELGTWKPDPPWAPPLNSPYFFSVTFDSEAPGPAGKLDVDAGPSAQLQIGKDGSDLALSWGQSCMLDDTDYAIYQGGLELLNEHAPVVCTTGGATSRTIPTPDGNAYFLINAQNEFVGGSYGKMSSGAERPKGNPVCLRRFIGECS